MTPVTMGFTMANPDAINDVAELRRELHAANKNLSSAAMALQEVAGTAAHLADSMHQLLDAFEAGEQLAVHNHLRAMANWRKSQPRPQQAH